MSNEKPLSDEEIVERIYEEHLNNNKVLVTAFSELEAYLDQKKHSESSKIAFFNDIISEMKKAISATISESRKQFKAKTDGSKEQAFSIIEDIKKITGCESNDSLDIVESVEKYVKTVELQGNENVSFVRKIRELEQHLQDAEKYIKEHQDFWAKQDKYVNELKEAEDKIISREELENLNRIQHEEIERLQKQLKEASSETKEDFEHEKIITEFADDSTKRLMKEIENLKQQLKESETEKNYGTCERGLKS